MKNALEPLDKTTQAHETPRQRACVTSPVKLFKISARKPSGSIGKKQSGRRRGVILVGVLWLILVLALLLLGLNLQVRLASARAVGQLDAVRAHWLARAGIERALAVLADDASAYDGESDFWYDDPLTFEDTELADGFVVRVTSPLAEDQADGSPRFGLDDEASRINLNRADRSLLSGIDSLDPAKVDALIDWVDNNEEAEPGGAERGYYQRLSFPYDIRNGPMRTHRETLLVKGIERLDYFGEDVDEDGVLDRRENDGDETWPPDSPDGRLDRGLAGLTTVYSYELNKTLTGQDRINLKNANADTLTERLDITRSLADRLVERGPQVNDLFDLVGERGENSTGGEQTNEVTVRWLAEHYEQLTLEDDRRLPGRVNVNTANRAVLESIPGLGAASADTIIKRRNNSGPFTSLGELVTTGTIAENQFRQSASFLTVRSNVLRVRSVGRTPSGASRSIVAVIDRGGETPSILYWWQSE